MIVKKNITEQSTESDLAVRIKDLRENKLRVNQTVFARLVGVRQPVISLYESGDRTPSHLALCRMGELSGPDKEWWLQQAEKEIPGEDSGGLRLSEVQLSETVSWDPEMLEFVIETVNEELKKRGRKLSDRKFAKIVVLIYEFCKKIGERDSEMVKRFLDAA
jgi:transcriptional regulator with XRE-family HTH domain